MNIIFIRPKPPFELFCQDLMKNKFNFDYYKAAEFYEKKLESVYKTRYELRYVQSRLYNDYKEIQKIKYNNLKKSFKKKYK